MSDTPPPETVPPEPAAPRANYVVTSPIISGETVVQSGRIVSLTETRAAEFAELIRPAGASDLAIAGGTWPIVVLD